MAVYRAEAVVCGVGVEQSYGDRAAEDGVVGGRESAGGIVAGGGDGGPSGRRLLRWARCRNDWEMALVVVL